MVSIDLGPVAGPPPPRRVFARLREARPNIHQLLRYAISLGVRGIEVVGKFGLYVMAARRLGAADAGIFFICLTWVVLAATAARMGLDRAITRHVAAELAIGQGRAAAQALRQGFAGVTAGSLVVALATALLSGPVARHLYGTPALAAPLVYAAIAIIPQAFVVTIGSALAGLKRGVMSQFMQNALWPILTLGAILAGAHTLPQVLGAFGLSLLASALFGTIFILADRPRLRDTPPPAGSEEAVALPSLLGTALPLMVVEMVQVSIISLPLLLLGVWADAAEVGAFSIANRISVTIWVIIISIGTIVAPQFAEHYRRHEFPALRAANRMARRAVGAFTTPVTLLMLLLPASLLHLVGKDFTIGAPALAVLAAGQMLNGLLSCQDIMLAMTGHGKILRRLNLLQLASCLVFGVVLIPRFGMLGAALVASLCTAQGAIGTTLVARRVLPQAF